MTCRSKLSLCLTLLFVSSLLSGCGYSVHRQSQLPFKEISIGLIENRTVEPKLQDRLHRALVAEFEQQGIAVSSSAKNKLTGTIHTFDLSILSEKAGIAKEFRVIVNIDFHMTDENGKTAEFKNISSPFIVSFTGSALLSELLATREIAEDRAMKDVASEIVAALIYK